MKVVVTTTGPQACGKTRLMNDLASFLKGYPMLTDTEVRFYEGDGRSFSDNASTFTVAASPSGRKEGSKSGDRETYGMERKEDGNWYVSRGTTNVAAFAHEDAARDFMRYEAAPAGRQLAADAVIRGEAIYFDGLNHDTYDRQNAKGGGGDSRTSWLTGLPDVGAELRKVRQECRDAGFDPEIVAQVARNRANSIETSKVSAAEAPAIHGLDPERKDDFPEMMTTYSEQLSEKITRILRNARIDGHTKTELRHIRNFLDKLTNSDVAIPCDFDDHERNHALHLADRLQEFAMANRASVSVNEGVKFDQTIEYLNRIAKGAGVILNEDGMEPDPVYAAARALYDAGYWTLANKWGDGSDPDEAKLWAELRDALKIPTGTETRRFAEKIAKNSTYGKINPNFAYGKMTGAMHNLTISRDAVYRAGIRDLEMNYNTGPEKWATLDIETVPGEISISFSEERQPFYFGGIEFHAYWGNERVFDNLAPAMVQPWTDAPEKYEDFAEKVLAQIAKACGVPYTLLTEDFDTIAEQGALQRSQEHAEALEGQLQRMIDRWEKQRDQIERQHEQLLVTGDMLLTIAELLEGYADNHDEKGRRLQEEGEASFPAATASHEKADRNRRYARMARQAVLLIETDDDMDFDGE